MNPPNTQRDEIRQLLAASAEPLTRPEIFAQCKLVVDELALSTVLSQLVNKGLISRVGDRARERGAPLALYGPAAGGGEASAPTAAGGAKRKGLKSAKRRASASKARRSASTSRSKALPKVQRKTATSPALEDFRCGIFSDGTLEITTKDGQVTLSEPETSAMFKYLDRVLGRQAA